MPGGNAPHTSLRSAVTSDILDSLGHRQGSLPATIKSLWLGAHVVGRAFPILFADVDDAASRCPGLVAACEQFEAGVVVVAGGHTGEVARWGELLSLAARQRGVIGAVIDGYARDVQGLERQRFPVFARGSTPCRPDGRIDVVEIGGVVQIGETEVSRGDLIVADGDGVVVVPAGLEDSLREFVARAEESEEITRAALASGRTLTEIRADGSPRED